MKKICFVIQPFDEANNKRYKSVIEPAIQAVGLHPYRVDKDKSAQILIENIEDKIRESEICFADISEDNPNVWYEVGFAAACEKKLVLACTDKRTKYPFDIQHKNIIQYTPDTIAGHKKLKKEMTERLSALIKSGR
jgi:nucleoside 2-deoxyribosyltransferase